jgi:hypothetical protein
VSAETYREDPPAPQLKMTRNVPAEVRTALNAAADTSRTDATQVTERKKRMGHE